MSTVLGVAPAEAQPRKMLDTVKARGQLLCGVLGTITGFSFADSTGVMRGIDADSCRASASASASCHRRAGRCGQGEIRDPAAAEPFHCRAIGEVDVLYYANTTWTIGRDSNLGLTFTDVNYYDGQGFLVPKNPVSRMPGSLMAPPSACWPAARPSGTWVTDFVPKR
ncbi:MAG: bacterial extracellular solute-binding s, 3 family protein [Roseomonas sp.]|nr:bacterial extracellular solute-binding s, 3 family protein [Roseomonas sp.]